MTWKDVAWYYLYPVTESAPIAGRLAFAVGTEGVNVVIDGIKAK